MVWWWGRTSVGFSRKKINKTGNCGVNSKLLSICVVWVWTGGFRGTEGLCPHGSERPVMAYSLIWGNIHFKIWTLSFFFQLLYWAAVIVIDSQYLLSGTGRRHLAGISCRFSDVHRSVLDPEGLRIRCLCCQKSTGIDRTVQNNKGVSCLLWFGNFKFLSAGSSLASSHRTDLFNVKTVADARCDKATTGCWQCTHLHVVCSPLGYKTPSRW